MRLIKVLLNPDPQGGGQGGSPSGGAGAPPAAIPPTAAQNVFAETPKGTAASAAPTPPAPVATPTPVAATSSTPATATLTAEQLTAAMKAAGIGQPATPQTPAKQYTQDDFDKAFNVVRLTPEDITALGFSEVQAPVLTRLLHAAAKQAVTMAAYQMQEIRDSLESKFNPIHTEYESKREQALLEEFLTVNKSLAGFEPVIKEVVNGLKSEKANFKNKEEAFTTVAERTIAFIRKLPGHATWQPGQALPAPAAGGEGGGEVKPTVTPTKMSTLTNGGQGGAGGGAGAGGGSVKKTPGLAVFD